VEHLGPQRRRLRAVGAGEVVEHARSRLLEQTVPERLEAFDDLFDQPPDASAVAGQPSGDDERGADALIRRTNTYRRERAATTPGRAVSERIALG
jgi:hypothetical protein